MEAWEIAEAMGVEQHTVLSFVGGGGKTSVILELARYWAAQGEAVLVTTTTHMEHPAIFLGNGVVDGQEEEILAQIRTEGWTAAGKSAKAPDKIQGISADLLESLEKKVDRVLVEADGSKRYPVKVPREGEPVISDNTTYIFILAGAEAIGRPLAEVCFRMEQAERLLQEGETVNVKGKTLSVSVLGRLLEAGYVKPLRRRYPQKKLAVLLNQADRLAEPERIRRKLQELVSVPVFLHGWKKAVHMIVLAAGFSRRFGENKLLYELDGTCMYQHLLGRLRELLEEGKADSLTVVTQYDEILETVKKQGLCAVKNEDSERGISSSLQIGLAKTREGLREGKENYYMFFAADQPYLQKETVREFLSAFLKSGKGIGCASALGELGNPVVFHEKYVPELMELSGDRGGKRVVRRHMEDVFGFEVQAVELRDLDYREEVEEVF